MPLRRSRYKACDLLHRRRGRPTQRSSMATAIERGSLLAGPALDSRLRDRWQLLGVVASTSWLSSPSKPPTWCPTLFRFFTKKFKYAVPSDTLPWATLRPTPPKLSHLCSSPWATPASKCSMPWSVRSTHAPVTLSFMIYMSEQLAPTRLTFAATERSALSSEDPRGICTRV